MSLTFGNAGAMILLLNREASLNYTGLSEADWRLVREIVRRALEEDLGGGDVTSNWTLPAEIRLRGQFLVKADGVLAGQQVARLVFETLNPGIDYAEYVPDGSKVCSGDIVAEVEGPGRMILSGERTALNFMQRMSGIATQTRCFVEVVSGTKAIILDTRKTAPGLRIIDKWAVRLGGGQNHRTGLYDMVLIKDNHIAGAGGITAAVNRVREQNCAGLSIEVEARTLEQVEEAARLQVDRIMLDNMQPDEMSAAVRLVAGRVPLEASGNVSLDTVARIAATGVDFISVGKLTHSVTALDVSLDIIN